MSDDSPAAAGAGTGNGSGSGKKSRKHKKTASHSGGAAATAAEGKDAPAPAPATPVKGVATDDNKEAPAATGAATASADAGEAATPATAVTETPPAKEKGQRPAPATPVDGVEYLLVSEREERERVSPTKKRDRHADALHANRGAVAFPIFCVSWWAHPAAAEVDAAASPSRAAANAAPAVDANGMLERVILGGGGGTSGTGVDSGAALCDVVVDEKTKLQSLHVIGRLDTRDALISGMAIHPLGTEVAMAIGGRTHLFSIRDSATRLYPIASFQTDFTEKLIDQLTSVVRFTPGHGDVLGAAGEDGTVRLWSYPTLRPLCVYQPRHTRSVTAIDFSTDGSVCVSTGEGERSCKLWRVPRPKATDAAATAAAMKLPAAADAPVAPADYLLREMKELHKGKALEVRACRFVRAPAAAAPAAKGAAAAAAGAGAGKAAGTAAADVGDELLLAVLNADPRGPSYVGKWAVPRSAAGQSTADAIAAAGAGAWQLLSLVCVDKASPATQLEVSADARRVAVTTAENQLYVYNIGGGADSGAAKALALYSTFLTPMHDLPCTGVAWSGDGRVLLSVSADKSTRFVPIRRTPRRSVLRLLFVNLLAIVLLYAVWRHFTAAATATSTDSATAAAANTGRLADRHAP